MSIIDKLRERNKANENRKSTGDLASYSSDSASQDAISRKQILLPLLLCVLGLGLNVGGKLSAGSLGLPFYFDTPGTILVSFLGGYVPGIGVALLTNILNYLSDDASIYYGLLNVLIAIVSVIFSRRDRTSGWKNVLLFVLVLALIGGGIGGILTWFLYGYSLDANNQMLVLGLQKIGMNEFWSWYLVTFFFDVIDKALSIVFVNALLYLIPRDLWKRFEMVSWKQRPMSDQERLRLEATNRNQRWSLKRKIVALVIVMSVLIAGISTSICLFLLRNYSLEQHMVLAEGVAQMVASTVDGDMVDRYLEKGRTQSGYEETERLMTNVLVNTPDVEYVYVYKIMEDGAHVVFDVDSGDISADELGTVLPVDEFMAAYYDEMLRGETVDPVVTRDRYGWLLTAYEPVFDSEGNVVCYAAADVDMDGIVDFEHEFILKAVCISMGFLVLLLAIGIWMAKYSVVLPIISMTEVADDFDYDDEFVRKRNVERLSRLNITTGDEVEQLYHAFLQTTDESTHYFEETKQKVEKFNAMQNGLVLVLADMVENRDESTGDHVRKTAAYVGITARKMRDLGYYREQMTDKFIRDAELSAPLHDIGKISVPDKILNKQGRLTDEEFAIMKTHAAEGRKLIEQAISTMPDGDYLEEAKNMAGYHHEKWDGSGYPEGLAGEDIPLSARIMAVADVFDALVSRRCYKEPFSYDKALSIIREDAGKHFDPLVADAFLSAKEEVLEVAQHFAERAVSVVDIRKAGEQILAK
ncbi:MAG: HD domain-containing protein [Lachnospiraceae bacterium]|nr:HD domain-containing protein [Lachnospiraceae bacterium]